MKNLKNFLRSSIRCQLFQLFDVFLDQCTCLLFRGYVFRIAQGLEEFRKSIADTTFLNDDKRNVRFISKVDKEQRMIVTQFNE